MKNMLASYPGQLLVHSLLAKLQAAPSHLLSYDTHHNRILLGTIISLEKIHVETSFEFYGKSVLLSV
jgi:hypothetical protein